MKNLLLAITLLLIVHLSFSQNLQTDFSVEIKKSGEYLQKASYDLKLSLGGAVLSGACFYWATTVTKDDPNASSTLQTSLGFGLAAVSVAFYVAHIVHIGKAGDHLIEADRLYKKQQKLSLSLQTNQDGIGLALCF